MFFLAESQEASRKRSLWISTSFMEALSLFFLIRRFVRMPNVLRISSSVRLEGALQPLWQTFLQVIPLKKFLFWVVLRNGGWLVIGKGAV